MAAKYSRLSQNPQPDQEDAEIIGEPGQRFNYTSPFNYTSIFSYNRAKDFKSPYTYSSSFDETTPNGNGDSMRLEKDSSKGSSMTRNIVETGVIIVCYFLLVMTFPLSLLFCLKFVSKFERLVVFRLGRLQDAKGPGAVLVLPCIDSYKRVDQRMKAFNVPPLQAITVDGGVIEFGATVYYRVKDALSSVLKVQDFNKALRNLAHSVLHRLANKHTFEAIDKDRKILINELQEELNKAAFAWGMEVGNVEMSDLRIIRKPEPQANKALQQLMQPDVMGQLWNAVGGKGPLPSFPTPMEIQTNGGMAIPMEDMINFNMPAPSEMLESNSDLTQLVDFIRQGLSDSLADEIGHIYQIECRGLGEFYMCLKRPVVCVGVGRLEKADVTISLERGDLIDLLSEKLAPLDAYLSGRISISGDTRAALQMQPLAARLKPFLRATAFNSGQQ